MDRKNARIALYALAGVYLLANAYQMFQNLDNSVGSGERTLTIIFIVVFAIVGSIMVGVGVWNGNKGMKQYKEEYYKTPEPEEDESLEIESEQCDSELDEQKDEIEEP